MSSLAVAELVRVRGQKSHDFCYLLIEYARLASPYFSSSILAASAFKASTDTRAALSRSASSA
jgi:hypothetical protein